MIVGIKNILLITVGFIFCIPLLHAQSPVATFSTDQNSGCSPLTVLFANTSTGAATYFWDFGNGNTSVLANPSNVYTNAGTYTVKLIATSANGQSDSLISTNSITVTANSVPDFNTPNPQACVSGNVFSFINTSSNATSYLWDFGDGSTSTQQNPIHSYTSDGNYTIKLVSYDNFGCPSIKTLSNYIQVNPNPVAEFIVNTNNGCDPSQVFSFTSTSQNATAFAWNFGDGGASVSQNPAYTYTTPGVYSVSLTATNTFGCSNTNTQYNYVSIETPQSPVFTTITNGGCIPVQASFTNQSPNAIDFLWNFGDGTTSLEESPTHTYQNSGNYTVSLTTMSYTGCTYTTTLNNHIQISNNPVANFSMGNTTACSSTVAFTNQSSNTASQLWEFGDGYTSTQQNPSHLYSGTGSFNVTLHSYSTSGCESVKQLTNAVTLTLPVAGFTTNYTPGCAPLTASFSNISANSVQWIWSFGDGSSSTVKNPSHTYNLPGNYDVSLISIDAQGCRDTLSFNPLIHVINTAGNFVTPPTVNGCVPFNTTFSNVTPGASSWLWNFGDGSSSTLQNPSHTYTAAGNYTVSLTVQMSSGCTQYYPAFRVFAIKGGQATFTASAEEICSISNVTFSGSCSGNLFSNFWEFGDGSTSTLQNPTHAFAVPGMYTVKYTPTTTDGCTATIIKTNCIHATSCSTGGGEGGNNSGGGENTGNEGTGTNSVPPVVTGCIPFDVSFNNTIPSTTSWLWNFGDGSTSTQQNPLHGYTNPGTYTVTLTAQTSAGTTQTVVYTNYIQALQANADFIMVENGNCQSSSVTLNTLSSNATSWQWDFGDGFTSSLQNPTHTYSNPTNNYIVTLTTTTAQGCSASLSKSLLLNGDAPEIWANKYDVCANETITFSCLAGMYTSYLWNFGDGSTSTLASPVHFYQMAGAFPVTLTVTDNKGCILIATLLPQITVKKPLAAFNYALTNGCSSQTVTFTNTSTGVGSPVSANSSWNFGDGSPSQLAENPTHTYTTQGTYQVTLTVYNNGCTTNITKTIYVMPVAADFSFTQNTTCLPATGTFTDISSASVSWLWDFGDGITSALQNPVHTYTTQPTADITLTVTGANGCHATITKASLTLFNSDFGLSVAEGCSPLFVEFNDASPNATQWTWNFGDGATSTLQNPSHTYTGDGVYTVKLIAKSINGCIDTAIFSAISTNKPVANFISANPTNCSPALVNFTDLSVNAVSWLWDFGDGSASVNQNPGHVYNIPGLYTIKLVVTNTFGCSDTLVKVDYILVPGSFANFNVSATQACAQSQVQFTDLSINATAWDWNFGDGNISSQQNPENTYQNPGQYTVSLIVHDANGCASSFTFPNPMVITALPTSDFTVSDTVSCTPFPVLFSNNSVNALSYSWDFGDGTTSTSQNPSHTYSTDGYYIIALTATNLSGCSAIKTKLIRTKKTPAADFAFNPAAGCSPLIVTFTNTTTNTQNASYLWNLGNGTSSASLNPSATYTNPGFYTVSLLVTNNNGCADTIIKSTIIEVHDFNPPPKSNIRVVSVTSDTTVQISWEQNDAEDFASYKIYRKDNATGIYSSIATINSRSLSGFTDGGRNTIKNSYCYKIQTIDICGYTKPLDSLLEHCTVNISAKGMNDDIQVNWTPYIGAHPETYSVYRLEPSMSGPLLVGTVPGNVLTYTDTTLACPHLYSYRVKANKLNGALVSSNSDTCIAKPINNTLVLQKVDVVRSTVIENSKVLTEWKAPVLSPEKVAGYAIYRSADNVNFSLLTNVDALARDFIDETVDVNTQNYYYKIKVLNYCDIASMESNKSSSILLKAELIDGAVNLKWTGYEGWNMGVDYYIIEKKNENGEWETIKQVEGNKLEYEDNE